jgi:hypothetical protein
MAISIKSTQQLTAVPAAVSESEPTTGTFTATRLQVADTTPAIEGGKVKLAEGATSEEAIIIRVISSTQLVVEELVNSYTTAAVVTFLGRTNPGDPLGQTIVKNAVAKAVNGSKNKAEVFWNNLALDIYNLATNITDILSNTLTIAGVKTFTSPPKMDQIDERTTNNGIALDGARIKDGMVKVSGTPTEGGEMGYASNRLQYHNGTSVITLPDVGAVSSVVGITASPSAGDSDFGKVYLCTGTFTFGINDPAGFRTGWHIWVRNEGTGVITIDPAGSVQIDTQNSILINPGESILVTKVSSTHLRTIGRRMSHAIVEDRKSQNTDGGTFTSGAWRTRDLNTEVVDSGGFCTVTSNQFTLTAGEYFIEGSAPAYKVSQHQARLQNITDAVTALIGTTEFTDNGDFSQTRSNFAGIVTITGTKTFEVQHQANTTSTSTGFGRPANFTTEIYTRVIIRKLA